MPPTYAHNGTTDYHVTPVTPTEHAAGRPYGHPMDTVANSPAGARRLPVPIVAIHVLAAVGILFWLSMIAQALMGGMDNPGGVVVLGIVLGGAHLAITWLTHRHSRLVYAAMWFVLVGDSLLAAYVDARAIALVLFTAVLLMLTRVPSARRWFAPPA